MHFPSFVPWHNNAAAPTLSAQVDLPVFYGNKMRRKMKAGAG